MRAASLPQLIRRREYERSWVRPDVLAGLTVAAMLVPQAMAYAELGGLPPSAGFRAALVALPIYALIGTSRHLGIGPEPGTAILAAAAAVQLAGGDPERYAALMATIAGLVGVFALACRGAPTRLRRGSALETGARRVHHRRRHHAAHEPDRARSRVFRSTPTIRSRASVSSSPVSTRSIRPPSVSACRR